LNSADRDVYGDDVKFLLLSWYSNNVCDADDHDDGYGTGDEWQKDENRGPVMNLRTFHWRAARNKCLQ
jgi:hypothetical protein